jgi:hypothetical protein
VFTLGFLANCSHVSSFVFSFNLLPMSARRPTFYRLNNPTPTSAPSKQMSFWDFPQGSNSSIVILFYFFLLCLFLGYYYYYYFPSLLFFLLALIGDLFFSHHI